MKLTNFVHNVVGYCTSNAESMVVVNVEVECTSLARLKHLVIRWQARRWMFNMPDRDCVKARVATLICLCG